MNVQESLKQALEKQSAGQLRQAQQIYQNILARQPNHPDAWHLLGVLAAQAGEFKVAIDLIQRAISINPSIAQYHGNLAEANYRMARLDEAIAASRKAIELKPDFAPAHHNLGMALLRKGMAAQAVEALTAAARLQPASAEIQNDLAVALNNNGQWELATQAARQAVVRKPGFVPALNSMGNALRGLRRSDEAIGYFRQAVALQPDHFESNNNLGNALYDRGQFDESIACYRHVLELRPDYAPAHNNLANSFLRKGMFDQAMANCRQALALRPDLAAAHWTLSQLLLLTGDFRQGWSEYDLRWSVKELGQNSPFHDPPWDGRPLDGRRIILHAEQGFGDTIQFFRYVPHILARGAKVVLACQPELLRLLAAQDGIAEALSIEQPLSAFDAHCPLLSLPRIFATDLTNIPASVPYLSVDADLKQHFRAELPNDKLKIGLTWAGRPTHFNDANRSFDLLILAPLFRISRTWFCSLQKGDAARQAQSAPPQMELTDLDPRLKDFADTAALIDNLDLVITADTAVAHLAGALGKPTWVLLPFVPDWRWMLNRDDSPWYPTLRLFRQPAPGDWQTPLRCIEKELALLAANQS
jgi:tetratricopeptide (TPR) repeat protein